MSTSSTVDGPGQLLGPVDLEVGRARGGSAGRRVAARAAGAFSSRPSALDSVPRRSRWNGSPNSYGLVVSSRSPPRPAAVDPVAAERVALEPREQVVEDLLADPPAAARRQLQPLAVARRGSRPPRAAGRGRRARRGRGRRRRRAGRGPRRGRWRRGRPGDSTSDERVLQPVHRLEPGDLGERALEAERLVAAEPDPVAEPAGQQQVEVGGELGEVDQQPVVAQERLHHRLELGALLRAHRAHQRLHRGHPLRRAGR